MGRAVSNSNPRAVGTSVVRALLHCRGFGDPAGQTPTGLDNQEKVSAILGGLPRRVAQVDCKVRGVHRGCLRRAVLVFVPKTAAGCGAFQGAPTALMRTISFTRCSAAVPRRCRRSVLAQGRCGTCGYAATGEVS